MKDNQILTNLWASELLDQYQTDLKLYKAFPHLKPKPPTVWERRRYALLRPFREAYRRVCDAYAVLVLGAELDEEGL